MKRKLISVCFQIQSDRHPREALRGPEPRYLHVPPGRRPGGGRHHDGRRGQVHQPQLRPQLRHGDRGAGGHSHHHLRRQEDQQGRGVVLRLQSKTHYNIRIVNYCFIFSLT